MICYMVDVVSQNLKISQTYKLFEYNSSHKKFLFYHTCSKNVDFLRFYSGKKVPTAPFSGTFTDWSAHNEHF